MIIITDAIQGDELLGRGVFTSKEQKSARRGRIFISVFRDDSSPIKISVDRLCYAPKEVLAELGNTNARMRKPIGERKFYGWAVIPAIQAAQSGRKVESSPTVKNPYHADICLPDEAEEDDEIWELHAAKLAANSAWRERPTP